MKPIVHIKNNPTLNGLASMLEPAMYAERGDKKLFVRLLVPQEHTIDPEKRFPLIVFIQGSAWTTPDYNYEIPQLSEFARCGYVVAMVDHRSCMEGAPAPAFLQDVKAAIRFLRANAAQYGIDETRVCAFGTSSGGNTALLLGLTHGRTEFDTDEYEGFSSEVQAVVDCFGPTDLIRMATVQYPDYQADPDALFIKLAGGTDEDAMGRLAEISPIRYVHEGLTLPPFLILHGDADDVVLYGDSVDFYEALSEAGHDATMYCVDGAPHEGSFWSRELLEIVFRFIEQKLNGG